ncbi:MAG TPA: hypothetical protein VGT44_15155, partial [Ktedonobacteraceae bacterium]|nr:hypothetical protein [Ktedonobacteraceae bacterium]
MKRSDSGDFYMLYIEPEDDHHSVYDALTAISRQHNKPVVMMLPVTGRARAFARPEDFSDLKRIKRQYELLILFVSASNEHLRHLAARNGFPAYPSIDELSDALLRGQISFAHQRVMAKTPTPSIPTSRRIEEIDEIRRSPTVGSSARQTVPLTPAAFAKQSAQPLPFIQPSRLAQSPSTKPSPRATPRAAYASADTPEATTSPNSATEYARPAVKKHRSRGLLVTMIILLMILLGGGGGLGYYFLYAHAATPAPVAAPQSVGQIYFLSSEQVSVTSNQGLNDEVQVDLHNLQPPAPGDSFYAWLLSDVSQGDTTVVYLGRLTVNQGSAHLLYSGDAQHTNLLAVTSRFLVTEESASITPIAPSPDYNTWRYFGIIPQTPNPQDAQHFSLLDHLRHLLASDPLLNELELPGGLCNWFYRNTGKLIEWTVSARDNWQQGRDVAFERRQTLRTLAYLDGLAFIQHDLPANIALPSMPNLASVGLIDVQGANQQPPSYLTHILHHLNGLINAPGATPAQRNAAAQIVTAMSNVQQWFELMRSEAQ